MTDRPPLPPRPRCIVSIYGVRCPYQPRYPGRDESSFCATHDDPENPETKVWQAAAVQVPAHMTAVSEHFDPNLPSGAFYVEGRTEVERASYVQGWRDAYRRLAKPGALAAQVPVQEERLDVERLMRTMRYHPDLRGKEGEYADGWDAATRTLLDLLAAEYRALGDESKEEGADHEHYWVDAADDETGWHCTICGVTEYPEPPFGAEAGPEEPDRP